MLTGRERDEVMAQEAKQPKNKEGDLTYAD